MEHNSDLLDHNKYSRLSVTESETFQLGFRSDIEGLRALAILLVVLAHAHVPWLKGGFVGVDVFYVLSGYLITGLILKEIQTTGKIRLLNFYSRRLKRLLPALLLMVVVTAVIAALLLAPYEQGYQATSALFASTWVSNIFFAFAHFDYFSPDAETNLYLHTWSLGVEEQFYLVWPALLMFLLGAWKWQGGTQNFQRLVSGMAATVAIGFLLSVFLSYTKPLWAFYLMPARAWQFAIGALALLWSTRNQGADVRIVDDDEVPRIKRALSFSGWIGLGLILIAAVMLDSNITYPGVWAAFPSVGAALVLAAGASGTRANVTRLLSIRPMQAIGRVSYAWYLWHWPILGIGDSIVAKHGPLYQFFLVVASFVLAVLSYLLVESPIRRNATLGRRPLLTVGASAVLTVAVITFGIGWQNAALSWSKLPEQEIFQEVHEEMPIIYPMGCDEWFYSAQVRICAFGAKDAKKTAVLMGDSIIGQWFPAVAALYAKHAWRLLVITKSACPMVDEPIFYSRIGMQYKVCSIWRTAALAHLVSLKPDVVLLGGTSTYAFNKDQWIAGTQRILEYLAPAVQQVFIIRGTPQLPFDGPNCLARSAWQPKLISSFNECYAAATTQDNNDVFEWLKTAASPYKNVALLDLNPLVCPDSRCYAKLGDTVVFRDSQHLSTRYVEEISNKIAAKIANIKLE